MAIVTATTFMQDTGQAFTGDDLGALSAVAAGVDAAVRRVIYPFVPEPTTVTDCVIDAPVGNALVLPVVPVRTLTSVYLRWGANGEVSEFTSDDLLTVNDDYWMPVDDPVRGYSRSGVVYRRGRSSWGYEWRRNVGRLANSVDPNRGSVKVTFAAGPTSVPDDVRAAANLATALAFARRKTGMPATSESWNGYSVSYASPFAVAAVQSPDVMALLAPYAPVRVSVG